MVLLSLFLLGGIDQAINPRSKQTIGRRVRISLTDDEFNRLTKPLSTPFSVLDTVPKRRTRKRRAKRR